MKNLIFSFAALLLLHSAIGTAQTPVDIGGYVETYYSYDFSKPLSGDRAFAFNHARHNEFAVNLALLDMRYRTDDMRARVALQTGSYAASNYAAEPALLQIIHEASAGFRLAENIWIDAGVLGSHIGSESAIGRDNQTLTRSLAAEYSPYYETGIRMELLPSPQWTVRALVLNGWQNIRETNSGKAWGTQVQWLPSANLLLNWSTFIGSEAPDSAESSTRIFNDIYAQFSPAESLKLTTLFDIGVQNNGTGSSAVWHTAAIIASYEISSAVSVAARGEYFSDGNAVVFPVDNLVSGSLNIDWRAAEKVTARVEGRFYNSEQKVFSTASGISTSNGVVTASICYTF